MPSYMQTKENKKQTRLVIAIFLAPTFTWKSFDKKEIGISKITFLWSRWEAHYYDARLNARRSSRNKSSTSYLE